MSKRPIKEILSNSFNKDASDGSYSIQKRVTSSTNSSKIPYYKTKNKSNILPHAKTKSRDVHKLDLNNRRAVTQKEKHISFENDIKEGEYDPEPEQLQMIMHSNENEFKISDKDNDDNHNDDSKLLRPSTGETHSARTSGSFIRSDIDISNK